MASKAQLILVPNEVAYAVPWSVDRSALPWCRLRNASGERLSNVSIQVFGDGWILPASPLCRHLEPGAELRIVLAGREQQDAGRVTVHWERSDGAEYAWTFVC
ncbi:MAG: hypothetical protein DI566_06345 [Microbacterium sp.]|nr:MAG: hypothetical protein DI566_06345 [Microbacterium sp.]